VPAEQDPASGARNQAADPKALAAAAKPAPAAGTSSEDGDQNSQSDIDALFA
jgi:hypothetical protein